MSLIKRQSGVGTVGEEGLGAHEPKAASCSFGVKKGPKFLEGPRLFEGDDQAGGLGISWWFLTTSEKFLSSLARSERE